MTRSNESYPRSVFLPATERLAAWAALVALFAAPAVTRAQEEASTTATPEAAPATPPPPPEKVEEIVVTGSRIATDPRAAPVPILRLTREDIAKTGLTSLGDILQRLPMSGGGLNSRFNSSGNFGFSPDGGGVGAGASEVDLRYLSSKRALVLVDGVRWVHGSSASGVPSATDLNTIPLSAVERIEILQDGASSIYGSDAIAGVVNIITRRDFQGFDARAYVGAFSPGDGETQQYDLSWGSRDDRTAISVFGTFVRQGEISSGDRDISKFPIPNVGACTNNGCSSGTPQGRFRFTDPNTGEPISVTINTGVGGVPRYDPSNPGSLVDRNDDFHGFDTADRFNFAPYNLVLTPSQRIGVVTLIEHRLVDNMSFVGKALFNGRKSKNQAAPEPLFIGPDGGSGNRLDTISIDVTNPYNPFGFSLDATSNASFAGRRPLEAGPRIFHQDVNTWYLLGGFSGSFRALDRPFRWDASTAYSQNRADQIKHGGFNSARLQKALGPVAECNAEPGCVPFNIFGGQGADGKGTITKEMLDYVTFVQNDISQQRFWDVTANLSGDVVDLPAGALSFAVGVEHRDQRGFFRPDPIVAAGDGTDVPASPTSGGFYVNEAYGEMVLPLVHDVMGFDRLDASAAARVSDYSTFGATQTFQAGMRWRPWADLLVRGNVSQGYRAPGIGELFGTKARYDRSMDDPCSDFLGNTSGRRKPQSTIDNCIALGVPADGSYEQDNPQISLTTGGNRDLDAEKSRTYTASLAYNPEWIESLGWVRSLNLELTYYNIRVRKAIQALNAQVQIDDCVRTLDPVSCAGISRTPGGFINGFENRLTNIGSVRTSGLELSLAYTSPSTPVGNFGLNWVAGTLIEFTERFPTSAGPRIFSHEGTENGDPMQAYPKIKSSVNLSWNKDDWRAVWGVRYIGAVTEQCRGFAGEEYEGLCSDPNLEDDSLSTNRIAATVYNDAQVTWVPSALGQQFDVTLGVNNVFNQDPPFCYSCALNGFDASTYDVPGVFGYLRAGYRL